MTSRSLRDAAGAIERRELSPVEITRACLDRIAAGNDSLRAFITVTADQALAEAARAEQEIARGHYRGPLHGIPVSIKDLVDVAGVPTTSGSRVPARLPTHDAPVVANLRRAGAVEVVTIDTVERRNEVAGASIAEHLARHGLKIELKSITDKANDVASTILNHVADSCADFVVMGGYGHSRLREFVLGGATRGMLRSMTVPTLMAH